ncbi:MAG: PqqD family protein [Desulfobulbaceae bacterium]|nr:PqqD family protein [Desulfobulbaceae bacterium]
MKLFRKKTASNRLSTEKANGLTRTESLASIPHRSPSATWEILENGDIIIEYPLNIKPFFLQLANRFNKGQEQIPTKKLQLDSTGSRVWQMFDGVKEVKTIIREVADQTGLSLHEAEISVTTFLRQLGQRGLILLS